MLIAIASQKQPKHTISISPLTVEEGESLWVISFDGLAQTKRKGGAYSAIVWKHPEWKIVNAADECDGLDS